MSATVALRDYDECEWVYCWTASEWWHWRQPRAFKSVERVEGLDPQDLIGRDEQRIDSDEFIVVRVGKELAIVQSIDFEED